MIDVKTGNVRLEDVPYTLDAGLTVDRFKQ